MKFWMESALESLKRGEFDNGDVREALPLLLELYDVSIARLFNRNKVSVEDMVAVVQNGSSKFATIAADTILQQPHTRITEVSLRAILTHGGIPDKHVDDAARRLLRRNAKPGTTACREQLAEVVAHARTQALVHRAATMLLEHPDAAEGDYSLIALYDMEHRAEAYARLGTLPPGGTEPAQA